MRKVPIDVENPIDTFCVDIGEIILPFFKKLNFTPNNLTTVSLIFGLLSIKHYLQKEYVKSAVNYFMSYMFDCFDGHYARTYNMTSNFGDYYDHFKDILIGSTLVFLLMKKYSQLYDWRKWLPTLIIVFIISSSVYLGCQEIYRGKNNLNSNFLSNFMKSCPKDFKEGAYDAMKYLRFGGTGTFTIIVMGLILYSKKVDEEIERTEKIKKTKKTKKID